METISTSDVAPDQQARINKWKRLQNGSWCMTGADRSGSLWWFAAVRNLREPGWTMRVYTVQSIAGTPYPFKRVGADDRTAIAADTLALCKQAAATYLGDSAPV